MSDGGSALTHSQQHIWVGQRLNPTSPLYNMAFAFVCPAELDADRFCAAWQRVAPAHRHCGAVPGRVERRKD